MTNETPRLSAAEATRIERELAEAYDFDPRDPLFGLTTEQLSGPKLGRRAVLRLLAAAGTLSAWHLLPGAGAPRPAEAAAGGGTLTCGWAGVGEITTLDPAQMNQVLQFQITSNVLSGLTHIDAKLVAQGDLAESWTVSDDGTVYDFKLREGVTFHNGDPFTADDVLFTYERSKDPKKSIHSRVLANVKSVEKKGDHQVVITLSKPQASFLVKTLERASGRAMTIVCRGAMAKMGEAQYGLMPVGTGPFRITAHELGQGVTLEKFDKYYDPSRPKLDKVVIKPIIDAEPLAAAMEAGDIQLIGGNPMAPELVDRFAANDQMVVNTTALPGFQSVWINPWHDHMKVTDFNKPLEELMKEKGFMVRLAIAKALDRERFIKQAQFGRGTAAYGTINPAMGFYFDEGLAETSNQRFDPAEAKKLMAAAGYPDGKGFPKLRLLATPSQRREAQIVAAMLKEHVGIETEIQTKDFPVLIEDSDKMDFDLMRLGSGGDYDPDDGLVDWMQTASKFNGRLRDKSKYPFGYFSDKEVDALTDQQSATADIEKRKALVQKANKITSDKVASGFLFHGADVLVYHKKVNFPAESRIPGLVDLDRVSLT
ncbi:peptide/nickel transport system substrate-binding protein [Tistlia consotensis]|uniref:Peptide/nickel transport system substrate-binding protein n=1 Tax=Tistlia consotensis USBA 355 TaxID=560819 RepID=A0A1Y6CG46_9PROT|nr:ABC transporter substrate-binding protein [Tistlia consotensis]SMF54432.1 peptide/nickel transport system substrate-binding protein [Tistlia consotensis USBA 355]SNR86950.1 peptide/nickel transport system substrate-binding protein [Tistlia consotensis]